MILKRWSEHMKTAHGLSRVEMYDIASEVLASAIVLQAVGFGEKEIPSLFQQAAIRGVRAPLWLEPPSNP
jgi:hypothetical protein